jgi:hypothetical protein
MPGVGVKIRHHSRRNQTVLVPLIFQRYETRRPPCPKCNVTHECKTLHIDVDDTGIAFVAAPIVDRLRRVPATNPHTGAPTIGGFEVMGEIVNPPKIELRPPTMRARVEAVDPAAFNVEVAPKRAMYSEFARNQDPETIKLMQSFDDYLASAADNGISNEEAINALMRAMVGMRKEAANANSGRAGRSDR